jgi:chromosome segregation ATPase
MTEQHDLNQLAHVEFHSRNECPLCRRSIDAEALACQKCIPLVSIQSLKRMIMIRNQEIIDTKEELESKDMEIEHLEKLLEEKDASTTLILQSQEKKDKEILELKKKVNKKNERISKLFSDEFDRIKKIIKDIEQIHKELIEIRNDINNSKEKCRRCTETKFSLQVMKTNISNILNAMKNTIEINSNISTKYSGFMRRSKFKNIEDYRKWYAEFIHKYDESDDEFLLCDSDDDDYYYEFVGE